jgi:hypothetical protein
MTSRRGFITGLISFVAAPAIVRASSIMPVHSIKMPLENVFQALVQHPNTTATEILERFANLGIYRQSFVDHWNETAVLYLP